MSFFEKRVALIKAIRAVHECSLKDANNMANTVIGIKPCPRCGAYVGHEVWHMKAIARSEAFWGSK